MSKRLLFVVNDSEFFLSHRLPIAAAAQHLGYEIHVATADGSGVKKITAQNMQHHKIPLTRSGRNPLQEINTIVSIHRVFKKIKPNLVHLVTIKPVLYGGVIARLVGIPGTVSAVSGLGFIYIDKGMRARLTRLIANQLYRFAFGKNNIRVIFQNPDDKDMFVKAKTVHSDKVVMISGSGVDLSKHSFVSEPTSVPVATMASRLLRDKGVVEFVEAARRLVQQGINARFRLVGEPDLGNPASVSLDKLNEWRKEGIVEITGFRENIGDVFASSNLVVLPSYREGMPKVLLEAAACGRAVVTTDVPGCRHAIEPGRTGLLVPVRDVDALAAAMKLLLEDTKLRQEMGQAGRTLAENEFTIENVIAEHLAVYESLEI